ncbi:Anthranilate synthase alpha subunit 2 chloroplastic [Zea mays]|uniref:Anthranilate synthase alpha subunit 2 chloroplastic n=1 Tax=Zea mays TaxID=4577 RepID=A0A1D6LAA3_MAIZE|nr:Anthranilate synthase alpha subunit 2 chloroplastic [Zea mays]
MRAVSNLVGRAAQHSILWRSTRGPTPECQAWPRRVAPRPPRLHSTPLHSPAPAARVLLPRAPPRPAPIYIHSRSSPSTTLLTAHSCSCHPARRPQSMATASLALSLRLAPSSRPLSLRRRGAAGVTCRATTATFHQLDAVEGGGVQVPDGGGGGPQPAAAHEVHLLRSPHARASVPLSR